MALKLVNNQYKCSSFSQVANAIEAGASGVLFTNIFDGTIPRTVGYAFVRRPVDISVCTITKEVGEIFRQSAGPIEIDWSDTLVGIRFRNQFRHIGKLQLKYYRLGN